MISKARALRTFPASAPEAALAVRDEYFARFHSNMKSLKVASAEGRLPVPFVEEELGRWWAERCEYNRYLRADSALAGDLRALRDAGATLAAFTNAPRAHGLRSLDRRMQRRSGPSRIQT